MITATELTKEFGNPFRKIRAVSNLNWNVPTGSIYGFLGPNGAGKTTTFKMLIGVVRPTNGTATVAGFDIAHDSVQIRKLAAFVPEQKSIYREMRVTDFLRFYGGFFTQWSPDVALRQLQTWDIPVHQRIGHLSKGMTTKVMLAAALARGARLLLLDEPTEGLDPVSVEDLLSTLAGWVAQGETSIVVASHRLEEMERICDHVGFMQSGRLAVSGALDDLRSSCKAIDMDAPLPGEMIKDWDEVQNVQQLGRTLRVVTLRDPVEVVSRLTALGAKNVSVHDLNLRDIYLAFCSNRKEVAA